jgi:hypothetical protein
MTEDTQRAGIRRLLWEWGNAVHNEKRIYKIIDTLMEEMTTAIDVHPQRMTGMPHSGQVSDPTPEGVLRIQHMSSEYRKEIAARQEEIKKIRVLTGYIGSCLEELTYEQQEVIGLRYTNKEAGKKTPWRDVAEKMEESEENCRKIEERAVTELEKYIEIMQI